MLYVSQASCLQDIVVALVRGRRCHGWHHGISRLAAVAARSVALRPVVIATAIAVMPGQAMLSATEARFVFSFRGCDILRAGLILYLIMP